MVENRRKTNPPSFGTFLWGDPLRIFRWIIPRQKLESLGYQKVYISRFCFRSARHNTGVWQTDVRTDGRTDRHVAVAKTRASIASRGLLKTRKSTQLSTDGNDDNNTSTVCRLPPVPTKSWPFEVRCVRLHTENTVFVVDFCFTFCLLPPR